MTAPTGHASIEHHPDVVELSTRFERATTTPSAQALEALAIVTGLFMAVSPWVVGFSDLTPLAVNNLIIGIAYLYCVMGYGTAYERAHARSWAAAAIGAWMILAPWAIEGAGLDTTRTITCNVIAGAVGLCLALMGSALPVVKRWRHAMAAYGKSSTDSRGMSSGG